MTTLQRTVPIAKDGNPALAIPERLHFHMPGSGNAGFHEQPRVAELRLGQTLHGDETLRQLVGIRAARHADAAATGRAFQHHRKAYSLPPFLRRVQVAKHVAAGQERHVGGPSQRPCFVLQAETADVLRARADEGDAGRFQRFGEGRVFAQEAVAGMNRLGLRAGNGVQELGLVQVGLRHPAFAERHRFPRRFHVQRIAVRFRVDRHAGNAERIQRPTDAHRDLAAVGDQHLVEHGALPVAPRPRPPVRWASGCSRCRGC